MRLAVVIAGLLLLTAGTASAAEEAIGRLNYSGYRDRMHCSATLIAPDRILTAAHCLRRGHIPDMVFLPGYDRGSWDEVLRPTRAFRAKDGDVATLCLSDSSHHRPLPIAERPPRPGENVVVIGYPRPGVHMQTRTECALGSRRGSGAITITCPMQPGASGGPVLRSTPDGPEIIAVVSATGGALSLAYDVAPSIAEPACP